MVKALTRRFISFFIIINSFRSCQGTLPSPVGIHGHSDSAPKKSASFTQPGWMDLPTALKIVVIGSSSFLYFAAGISKSFTLHFGVFCISLSIDVAAGSVLKTRRCIGKRSMWWILAYLCELCLIKLCPNCEHSRFQAHFGPFFTVC